jgi:hypothetical protein
MTADTPPLRLRKYTSLAVAIDLLRNRRLALVDPRNWVDRNDIAYLQEYKRRKALKTLVVSCFTTKAEQYHHWKSFADGTDGVCIQFHGKALIDQLARRAGFRCGLVVYKRNNTSDGWSPKTSEIPFLKRLAYRDEGEYRILFEDKEDLVEIKELPLDLNCVSRITISPRLAKGLFQAVKEQLSSISSEPRIPIVQSSILDSALWRGRLGKPA